MNSALVFVLALVSIVMCANIIETWLKQRKRQPRIDAELEETLGKIEHLEERIVVLERIITESRIDLKSEIDAL